MAARAHDERPKGVGGNGENSALAGPDPKDKGAEELAKKPTVDPNTTGGAASKASEPSAAGSEEEEEEEVYVHDPRLDKHHAAEENGLSSSSSGWPSSPPSVHGFRLVKVLVGGRTGHARQIWFNGQLAVTKVADIFKCSYLLDELTNEEIAYERLKDVQGDAVPILLSSGVFREGFLYGLTTSYGGVDGTVVETFTPEMVEQAVAKLRQLHERGVFHQDIRRSNVLYDPATGKVMLMDLAQAVVVEGDRAAVAAAMLEERSRQAAEREVQKLRDCLEQQQRDDGQY